MKLDTSSRKLPTSPAHWEKLVATAAGKDRPTTAKEDVARQNAVALMGGGYGAVRDALAQKRQGQRGPQQRPTKMPVTVRYNPEVVAYFKATGAGWQTRMNDVLCDWVAKHEAA